MLSSISWGQYIRFILLISATYYGYIGLKYYRGALINWIKQRWTANHQPEAIQPATITEIPQQQASPAQFQTKSKPTSQPPLQVSSAVPNPAPVTNRRNPK